MAKRKMEPEPARPAPRGACEHMPALRVERRGAVLCIVCDWAGPKNGPLEPNGILEQ